MKAIIKPRKSFIVLGSCFLFFHYLTNQRKSHYMSSSKAERKLLYSWGNGFYGQLGISDEKMTISIPKAVVLPDDAIPEKIFARFDSSACLSSDGTLYVWGRSNEGSIGKHTSLVLTMNTPIEIPYQGVVKSFKSASLSKEHGGGINQEGELFTWGVDNYGKLGIQHEDHTQQSRIKKYRDMYEKIEFGKVNLPSKVLQYDCGFNHSICLTEDGKVYTWGDGKDHCLGNDRTKSESLPVLVENLEKIVQVQAGNYFNLALDDEGNVFSWGNNNYGQLGIGLTANSKKPSKITFKDQIVQIKAGEDHSGFITNKGEAYLMGYGLDGRLGNGSTSNTYNPKKVTGIQEPITKISLGGHHSAFLTESGKLYMVGNGRDGELGRGDVLESTSVQRVSPLLVVHFELTGEKVMDIECGGSHCLALVQQRF